MSAAAAIANGTECNGRAWYVARTMSRHEKKVADLLQVRAIDNCLPLYAAIRQWSDRTKRVMVPLFPGYVFVNIAYEDRLRVLEVPGLVGFVKFGDKPAPLTATDSCNLEILRTGVSTGSVQPFPYLQIGKRVRVATGAFAGLEGVLKKKKGVDRLIISVHQIQRSVMVEISGADVHPVCS